MNPQDFVAASGSECSKTSPFGKSLDPFPLSKTFGFSRWLMIGTFTLGLVDTDATFRDLSVLCPTPKSSLSGLRLVVRFSELRRALQASYILAELVFLLVASALTTLLCMILLQTKLTSTQALERSRTANQSGPMLAIMAHCIPWLLKAVEGIQFDRDLGTVANSEKGIKYVGRYSANELTILNTCCG